MAMSVLDQIRTVEHQKAKVKAETLRKVRQALSELNKLGFDYRVAVNGRVAERVRRSTRTLESAPCRICGFRMMLGHIEDKRRKLLLVEKSLLNALCAAFDLRDLRSVLLVSLCGHP